jgi:hypothetical protein
MTQLNLEMLPKLVKRLSLAQKENAMKMPTITV